MNKKNIFFRKREAEAEEAAAMEENQEPSLQAQAKDGGMEQEIALELDAGFSPQIADRNDEEEPVKLEPLVRSRPSLSGGLTEDEVSLRIAHGAFNKPVDVDNVTIKDIVKQNVLTYFNLIFLIITILLIVVGSYRDLTFLPIIVANTLIGIFQEWRSKVTLDKLTIMSAPKIRTLRGGVEKTIPAEQLVLDDLVIFEAGNQIPADAVVEEGEVQVNEALLTGEADEILKKPGDGLLSGSFIVSGQCKARLDKVGADSYISKLTLEAKARKNEEESEMIRSLDRLVKIIGVLIIPIGILLFSQQYFINGESLKSSVTATVAAVIGMIPEGLYLLASVAMAVSVMRLAFGKVLVHSMKSIETLARVDVLCVDKTGTITENTMTVKKAVPLYEMNAEGEDPDFSPEELATLELQVGDFVTAMNGDNITMQALQAYFQKHTGRRPDQVFSFSSENKYSGAVFGEHNYVMGAPEFLLRSSYQEYQPLIEKYSSQGYRVLLFGEYQEALDGGALKAPVIPKGMVLMANPVRENAPETFRYFADQGVAIKVISGDNPVTVSEVAKEAGIENAEAYIDVSMLHSEEELLEAAEEYTVFGRVKPDQKRQLIAALKQKGHTVAMTGDGVNDVLALKDADCSIAMASGSDAAAHAAQMVLLESDFSKMPSVVAEGRRVVNNIERTASLFLVKNIFSLLMSVFSIVFMMNYPLEPSQISLISMFTIGIPAFFMSLEQNRNRIQGRFLNNVFFRALPAGLTDFAVISGLVIFCREFMVGDTDLSTSCTILLAIVGIMILYKIMSPMSKYHWGLWFAMIFGILFCMTFMNRIFAITTLSRKCAMLLVIFAIITEPALRYLSVLVQKIWDAARWIKKKWQERKTLQTI